MYSFVHQLAPTFECREDLEDLRKDMATMFGEVYHDVVIMHG